MCWLFQTIPQGTAVGPHESCWLLHISHIPHICAEVSVDLLHSAHAVKQWLMHLCGIRGVQSVTGPLHPQRR